MACSICLSSTQLVGRDMYNRGPQSGRHLEAHLLYDFFVDFFLHLIGDFSAGISMLYDMSFRSDLAEGRKQL